MCSDLIDEWHHVECLYQRIIGTDHPKKYRIVFVTNMADSKSHINAIVIGAGFAGLSVAIELAKRGAKVVVFESAPDMKRQGMHLYSHREDSQCMLVLTARRGRDSNSSKCNPTDGIMG